MGDYPPPISPRPTYRLVEHPLPVEWEYRIDKVSWLGRDEKSDGSVVTGRLNDGWEPFASTVIQSNTTIGGVFSVAYISSRRPRKPMAKLTEYDHDLDTRSTWNDTHTTPVSPSDTRRLGPLPVDHDDDTRKLR